MTAAASFETNGAAAGAGVGRVIGATAVRVALQALAKRVRAAMVDREDRATTWVAAPIKADPAATAAALE